MLLAPAWLLHLCLPLPVDRPAADRIIIALLQERAEVLLGELMGDAIGKSAQQAAELFVRCPALANTGHIMPSIVRVVAEHHGEDSD